MVQKLKREKKLLSVNEPQPKGSGWQLETGNREFNSWVRYVPVKPRRNQWGLKS
jgi:hypothetical protein